jgi:chromodomain-helicase-DNA-binding protein 1
MPRDDKVAMLKESLAAIGRRIDDVLTEKHALGEDADRWRRHLWTYVCSLSACTIFLRTTSPRFVTLFWPKKVKASKLEEIHAKMVMKEAAPRAQSDGSAMKKPRISSKANGARTMQTNGKSTR